MKKVDLEKLIYKKSTSDRSKYLAKRMDELEKRSDFPHQLVSSLRKEKRHNPVSEEKYKELGEPGGRPLADYYLTLDKEYDDEQKTAFGRYWPLIKKAATTGGIVLVAKIAYCVATQDISACIDLVGFVQTVLAWLGLFSSVLLIAWGFRRV